jgi:PadR family transcriptional regulator PadR
MKVSNTISQMRKGVLEYCVLLLLDKEEIYASDIIGKLKEGKLIVVEGTLYPLLTRLKNAELANYRWEESDQGPPRKYYKITEKGKAFLDELRNTWDALNNTISSLD